MKGLASGVAQKTADEYVAKYSAHLQERARKVLPADRILVLPVNESDAKKSELVAAFITVLTKPQGVFQLVWSQLDRLFIGLRRLPEVLGPGSSIACLPFGTERLRLAELEPRFHFVPGVPCGGPGRACEHPEPHGLLGMRDAVLTS